MKSSLSFYTKLMFALALSLASLCSASAAQETVDGIDIQDVEGYEERFPALGTLVSLKAYHHDPNHVRTVFAQARLRIGELESILTDYEPQSETRKLTELASRTAVQTSGELWQVLVASDEWHRKTGGAFDSSLGNLTQLWRKYRRTKKIPETELVEQALHNSGWQQVHLDRDKRTVQFSDAVRIDFGGIGKGFIVDQVFGVLTAEGLECCLVDISGNMRCGPAPPGRNGWRIEIAPLKKGGKALKRIEVQNVAIATSGDLWQYIEFNGKRHSHILDPRTGYGVLGPISATVVATTATDADAFATAACILDTKYAIKRAEELNLQLLVARISGSKVVINSTSTFPLSIKNLGE